METISQDEHNYYLFNNPLFVLPFDTGSTGLDFSVVAGSIGLDFSVDAGTAGPDFFLIHLCFSICCIVLSCKLSLFLNLRALQFTSYLHQHLSIQVPVLLIQAVFTPAPSEDIIVAAGGIIYDFQRGSIQQFLPLLRVLLIHSFYSLI